jgi:glycosyltransferase involved in cell wall biosynthesis
MPNKLGEYLASGAPVITCTVGDVGRLLKDGETAFLCRAGDVEAFATKVACAVTNPLQAQRVGQAGQNLCRRTLDLRNHAAGLAKFFNACISSSDETIAVEKYAEAEDWQRAMYSRN